MDELFDILEVLGFRSPRLLAPFPPLPVELIRYIMEIAAEECHSTALCLTVVSQLVRDWITPIIYRTVILRTSQHVASFHLALRHRPKAASQVRNIFIGSMSDTILRRLVKILSTCTKVDRLILDHLYRLPVDHSLSWPAPWEVVFIYGASSWLGKAHPILRDVTHIHLDEILFDSTLDACKQLPRLTHVGINHHHTNNNVVYDSNFVRLIRRLLSSTPSLEIVLLHSFTNDTTTVTDLTGAIWGQLANIEDERLLVRPGLQDEEYYRLLRSGTSIWDDARVKFGSWRSSVRSS